MPQNPPRPYAIYQHTPRYATELTPSVHSLPTHTTLCHTQHTPNTTYPVSTHNPSHALTCHPIVPSNPSKSRLINHLPTTISIRNSNISVSNLTDPIQSSATKDLRNRLESFTSLERIGSYDDLVAHDCLVVIDVGGAAWAEIAVYWVAGCTWIW